jgi:hypothetical protein
MELSSKSPLVIPFLLQRLLSVYVKDPLSRFRMDYAI